MLVSVLKYTAYDESGALPPYDGDFGTVELQKWYSKEILESHNWVPVVTVWNHSVAGHTNTGGGVNHGYKLYQPELILNEDDPYIKIRVDYNTVGRDFGPAKFQTEGWAVIEVTLYGFPITSLNP